MQMSYTRKIEYEIMPEESFAVIRGCSGCGRKARFTSTGKFRVNAGGNKLDVWLIYQCENCKHTLNLTVYERKNAASIPKQEYEGFLNNDRQLAQRYGRDIRFFQKNKARIDVKGFRYSVIWRREVMEQNDGGERLIIEIHNSCGIKLRLSKQLAEALGISVSRVRKEMEQGGIRLTKVSTQFLSASVENSSLYMQKNI